jgi:hypothetical protein
MELVRRIPSPFPLYFLRSMFYLKHRFFTDLTVSTDNKGAPSRPGSARNGALDRSELTQLDVLGNWRGRVRESQLVWTTLNLAVPLPIGFL